MYGHVSENTCDRYGLPHVRQPQREGIHCPTCASDLKRASVASDKRLLPFAVTSEGVSRFGIPDSPV
jgi:hypothetical protein